MITAEQTVRRVRGAVVGAASGATAVVAHALAHGGLPSSAAMTVMLAVCGAVGWTVAARGAVFEGWTGLLVGLTGAQVAAHLALSVVADGHSGGLSGHMVSMHAVAIVATAALCRALERSVRVVLTALIRVVRVLLSVPADRRPSWTVRTGELTYHRLTSAALAAIGTRGPPTGRLGTSSLLA